MSDANKRDRIIEFSLAGLVALIVAAYLPSLNCPFDYDDIPSIVNNESIRQLDWNVLSGGIGTAQARPVLNFSLALNYAAGGLNVYGYHVVNLEIHIIASLLLFGIVHRTLEICRKSNSYELTLAITSLWALHPILTASITSTIQRAESLMGLFYLLTLYSFIRGVTDVGIWNIVAVVACSLGMATKETMVTAPIVILLYDMIFFTVPASKDEFASHAMAREHGRNQIGRVWWRWPMHLWLFATWIVLIPLISYRSGTAGFGLGMSVWEYARLQPWMICRYVWVSIFPVYFLLGRDWQLFQYSLSTTQLGMAWAAIGVALLATIWSLRFQPKLGFVGAWFFLILAPSSSVLPIVSEIGAEHRMYLPLVSIAVLTILGADIFTQKLNISESRRNAIMICLCSLAVGAMACRTAFRNGEFKHPHQLSQTAPFVNRLDLTPERFDSMSVSLNQGFCRMPFV